MLYTGAEPLGINLFKVNSLLLHSLLCLKGVKIFRSFWIMAKGLLIKLFEFFINVQKLAMLPLLPTLYSHQLMLVNVKLEIRGDEDYIFCRAVVNN